MQTCLDEQEKWLCDPGRLWRLCGRSCCCCCCRLRFVCLCSAAMNVRIVRATVRGHLHICKGSKCFDGINCAPVGLHRPKSGERLIHLCTLWRALPVCFPLINGRRREAIPQSLTVKRCDCAMGLHFSNKNPGTSFCFFCDPVPIISAYFTANSWLSC